MGLAAFALRGRRWLGTKTRYIVFSGILYGLYVAALCHLGRDAERYYRPLLPLLFVLAGGGYYCCLRELADRRLLQWAAAMMLVGVCVVYTLKEPIRAHREPQTRAGLWLAGYDPDYKGFALSSYSQPVYYAGMRFLDSGKPYSQEAYGQLVDAGLEPKYLILDSSDAVDYPWLGSLIASAGWNQIYSESTRSIRIYRRAEGAERRNESGLKDR